MPTFSVIQRRNCETLYKIAYCPLPALTANNFNHYVESRPPPDKYKMCCLAKSGSVQKQERFATLSTKT